jgi:hypothetical protein
VGSVVEEKRFRESGFSRSDEEDVRWMVGRDVVSCSGFFIEGSRSEEEEDVRRTRAALLLGILSEGGCVGFSEVGISDGETWLIWSVEVRDVEVGVGSRISGVGAAELSAGVGAVEVSVEGVGGAWDVGVWDECRWDVGSSIVGK